MGLSNKLSREAWSFSCPLNPHRFFQSEVLRLSFLCTGTLGCVVCLAPSCSSLFIHIPVWNHQLPPRPPSPPATCVAVHPLHPGYPSLPLLPVSTNVSSLTPWLLDFHTVQFSSSSGCFLFLNLLLSFFLLCEEAKCIYLCLHLGQKCQLYVLIKVQTFLSVS